MGRLVRIIIYAVAIMLVYFLVVNTMDTYTSKTKMDVKEVVPMDSIIDAPSDVVVDTIDVGNEFISDADIVNGDFDYEGLDEKVLELEKTKQDPEPPKKSGIPSNPPPKKDKPVTQADKPVQSIETIDQSNPEGKYLVMAGSFLLKENAESLVAKLHKLGYKDARIVIFQSSQYHSVLAAKYDSEDKARNVSAQLKQKGIDNYVKTAQ
ncbi:MAG: SPOR domain-containing protein [Chitinophagales bacterium]|nr:SPOR domain-containing protein [Chitinophagales bacterium]